MGRREVTEFLRDIGGEIQSMACLHYGKVTMTAIMFIL